MAMMIFFIFYFWLDRCWRFSCFSGVGFWGGFWWWWWWWSSDFGGVLGSGDGDIWRFGMVVVVLMAMVIVVIVCGWMVEVVAVVMVIVAMYE